MFILVIVLFFVEEMDTVTSRMMVWVMNCEVSIRRVWRSFCGNSNPTLWPLMLAILLLSCAQLLLYNTHAVKYLSKMQYLKSAQKHQFDHAAHIHAINQRSLQRDLQESKVPVKLVSDVRVINSSHALTPLLGNVSYEDMTPAQNNASYKTLTILSKNVEPKAINTLTNNMPYEAPTLSQTNVSSKVMEPSSKGDSSKELGQILKNVSSKVIEPSSKGDSSKKLGHILKNVPSKVRTPINNNIASKLLKPLQKNVTSNAPEPLNKDDLSKILDPIPKNVSSKTIEPNHKDDSSKNMSSAYLELLNNNILSNTPKPLLNNMSSKVITSVNNDVSSDGETSKNKDVKMKQNISNITKSNKPNQEVGSKNSGENILVNKVNRKQIDVKINETVNKGSDTDTNNRAVLEGQSSQISSNLTEHNVGSENHSHHRNHSENLSKQVNNTDKPINADLDAPKKPVVTLLLWSQVFQLMDLSRWDTDVYPCSYTDLDCRVLSDQSQKNVNISDAVLFHWRFMPTKPSGFFTNAPRYRPDNQLWLLFNNESPEYSATDAAPVTFYGIFNQTVHYSPVANIHVPYGECKKIKGDKAESRVHVNKTGLVSWFVSRCSSTSRRLWYAQELQWFIPVDIYGECGNMPAPRDESCLQDKAVCDPVTDIINKYKFYLAFENSLCEHYVTEKLFKIMRPQIRTVPIVYGLANYSDILPPHSFIDVRDFSSPQELAKYLQKLDQDDQLYNEYFAWKEQYFCNEVIPPCVVCKAVQEMKGKKDLRAANLRKLLHISSCMSATKFLQGIFKHSLPPWAA